MSELSKMDRLMIKGVKLVFVLFGVKIVTLLLDKESNALYVSAFVIFLILSKVLKKE